MTDQAKHESGTLEVRVPQGESCEVLSAREAERAFSISLVVSGVRCTLAYVVFPFVLPLLGVAPGIGPWLGVVIGTVALVANVFSIRRFRRSDHRLKRPVIAINVVVIAFLVVLMANDLLTIIG